MSRAKVIYQLMNDLLRYLLKYAAVESFCEADVEEALQESEQICKRYEKAPDGVGYLAWKMCVAINSYFTQWDKKRCQEEKEEETDGTINA